MSITTSQLAAIIGALTGQSETQTSPNDGHHGLAIVVADRGHVWVGDACDDGEYTIIKDAQIVRVWGAERGLNQIANHGPTDKTKLDEPATVKVAKRAVIAIIPCEASAWSGR